jgi:hypothetical protein
LPELGCGLALSVLFGAVLLHQAVSSSGRPITRRPLRDFVSAVSSALTRRRSFLSRSEYELTVPTRNPR